jgi:hypothetical protein
MAEHFPTPPPQNATVSADHMVYLPVVSAHIHSNPQIVAQVNLHCITRLPHLRCPSLRTHGETPGPAFAPPLHKSEWSFQRNTLDQPFALHPLPRIPECSKVDAAEPTAFNVRIEPNALLYITAQSLGKQEGGGGSDMHDPSTPITFTCLEMPTPVSHPLSTLTHPHTDNQKLGKLGSGRDLESTHCA